MADIDGDGDIDVIGASYYDSSLRWFENDGHGEFTPHLISQAVNEGQGVTVADLDNDGDPDIITASSGDNTIAVSFVSNVFLLVRMTPMFTSSFYFHDCFYSLHRSSRT